MRFFLVGLFVLLSSAASAQTQTQSTSYCQVSNSTTATCDFTALPSATNFILVQGQRWSGTATTVTGCSDNQGNTYAVAVQSAEVLSAATFICFAQNIGSPSGTLTVTVTAGQASYWQLKATSWSGVATTGALDVTTSSTGGPNTAAETGATGVPAQPDNLVAIVLAVPATQTSITVDTSASPAWTEQFEELTTNICCAGEVNTRVISSSLVQVGSWTLGDAAGWSASIAVFKSSGGGGGGTPVGSRILLTGAGK